MGVLPSDGPARFLQPPRSPKATAARSPPDATELRELPTQRSNNHNKTTTPVKTGSAAARQLAPVSPAPTDQGSKSDIGPVSFVTFDFNCYCFVLRPSEHRGEIGSGAEFFSAETAKAVPL